MTKSFVIDTGGGGSPLTSVEFVYRGDGVVGDRWGGVTQIGMKIKTVYNTHVPPVARTKDNVPIRPTRRLGPETTDSEISENR